MPRLDTLTLRVRDPNAQRLFYIEKLGMSDLGAGLIGYAKSEVALRFLPAEQPHEPQTTDLYWKIAVSVPDIDLAYRQLAQAGVTCSAPHQFRDVGYLAKVTDPEGFTVELIDHWFQGQRPSDAFIEPGTLGGGAHLSLVTLRSPDISTVEPDLLSLGMTAVSVQPVTSHGFTLYFYAFTTSEPPNSDLTAIENRTWVYQRRDTVLEFQQVEALKDTTLPQPPAAGYASLTVSGLALEALTQSLRDIGMIA